MDGLSTHDLLPAGLIIGGLALIGVLILWVPGRLPYARSAPIVLSAILLVLCSTMLVWDLTTGGQHVIRHDVLFVLLGAILLVTSWRRRNTA